MMRDTIERLDKCFRDYPMLMSGPVSEAEVAKLEQDAAMPLPASYREFVQRYGGAIVGPYSVFGIGAAEAMGNDQGSAIEVTQWFRKDGWAGTESWLVVSVDHAGNPIGLDADGRIWISDHDAGVIEVIAGSFEEYIRKNCLELSD